MAPWPLWAWRAAGKQEASSEEAAVASCGPAKTALLALLQVRTAMDVEHAVAPEVGTRDAGPDRVVRGRHLGREPQPHERRRLRVAVDAPLPAFVAAGDGSHS